MQNDTKVTQDAGYNRDEWRAAASLAVELVGVGVLIGNGLPIYRTILSEPNLQIQDPWNLIWALVASALIQVGYWYRRFDAVPVSRRRNILVGHIILFVSRLSFLFATSAFGYVFISGNVDFQVSGLRYLVFFVGLFSLFCFVQELERLGRAMCIRPTEIKA